MKLPFLNQENSNVVLASLIGGVIGGSAGYMVIRNPAIPPTAASVAADQKLAVEFQDIAKQLSVPSPSSALRIVATSAWSAGEIDCLPKDTVPSNHRYAVLDDQQSKVTVACLNTAAVILQRDLPTATKNYAPMTNGMEIFYLGEILAGTLSFGMLGGVIVVVRNDNKRINKVVALPQAQPKY
jgi:hypothetical protein